MIISIIHKKPIDEGLSTDELTNCLKFIKPCNILPISVYSTSGLSIAIGLINFNASDALNHDLKGLKEYLGNILANMLNESPSGVYIYNGLSILMTRNCHEIRHTLVRDLIQSNDFDCNCNFEIHDSTKGQWNDENDTVIWNSYTNHDDKIPDDILDKIVTYITIDTSRQYLIIEAIPLL